MPQRRRSDAASPSQSGSGRIVAEPALGPGGQIRELEARRDERPRAAEPRGDRAEQPPEERVVELAVRTAGAPLGLHGLEAVEHEQVRRALPERLLQPRELLAGRRLRPRRRCAGAPGPGAK